MQVVLPGFSVILFCFVQSKTLCRYGCMYFLAELVHVCVDVFCVDHDLNRCSGWWYVCIVGERTPPCGTPVFVNCLVKQFTICLGVVVILLLNVMEVFNVGGGALLDIPCMVCQRMCVLCL